MAAHMPDELLELMAGKFRLLGDATRLAILRALMAGEKSVGQIVEETGRGQANVSKHLKMLADAELVGRRKEGLQVFYRVCDPMIEQLCRLVCGGIVETLQRELEAKRRLIQRMNVGS